MDNFLNTVFHQYPDVMWMMVGCFFLLLEAFAISGVGFLFGGLGALTLGGLIAFGALDKTTIDIAAMFTYFFVLTGIWAAAIWMPFTQRASRKRPVRSYYDLIGDTAVVVSPKITRSRNGVVRWSGTNLKAMMAPELTLKSIPEGQEVWITGVDGSTVIVRPLGYKKLRDEHFQKMEARKKAAKKRAAKS